MISSSIPLTAEEKDGLGDDRVEDPEKNVKSYKDSDQLKLLKLFGFDNNIIHVYDIYLISSTNI